MSTNGRESRKRSAEIFEKAYAPVPTSLARTDLHLGSWFQKHPRIIRLLGVLAAVSGLLYMTARLLYTHPDISWLSFTPLFLAELFGFSTFLIFLLDTWKIEPTPRLAPLSLSCDILIPTFDEGVEIVEPTIVGAIEVRGNTKIWLLDDGRRPEMATLAKQYGIEYRTRADNKHAKAGNINATLRVLQNDLVLILDADHVPAPDFLEATSGYFADEKVSLVQTAHSFRNQNSVAHEGLGRNEQSLFFDVLLPGRNRINSVLWCGSAAVLRRSALLEVGGIATYSIVEDFETSLEMRRAGMKVIYHNEHLVQGLAPDNLNAYLIQKHRWAKGLFMLFRPGIRKPLRKELGILERISYIGGLFYYVTPVQKLVYFVNLIVVACFSFAPLRVTTPWYLLIWPLATILNMIAVLATERGSSHPFEGMRNSFITMEAFLRAMPSLWSNKPSTFVVTPKNEIDLGGLPSLKNLRLPIIIVTLTTLALSYAWLNYLLAHFNRPVISQPVSLSTLLVISTFGISEIVVVTRYSIQIFNRRQLRELWRFPVKLESEVGGRRAICTDLHQLGASMIVNSKDFSIGDNVDVVITCKDLDGKSVTARATGLVRWVSRRQFTSATVRLGLSLDWHDEDSRRNIIRQCYVVEQYVARQRFWLRRDPRALMLSDATLDGMHVFCEDISKTGASVTILQSAYELVKLPARIPLTIDSGFSGFAEVKNVLPINGDLVRLGLYVEWSDQKRVVEFVEGSRKVKKQKKALDAFSDGLNY